MNKALSYILMLASVLLAGCTPHVDITEEDHACIVFDMGMDQTKSLISPSNLNTEGNRFVVYDVHTSAHSLVQYMDEQCLQYKNGQWSFVKSADDATVIQIPWTKKGTHDFLAHNTYDASSSKPLPVKVSYTSFEDDNLLTTAKQQSLRIPATDSWTLTKDSQFDFIYGSATRDVSTGGYAPVPISFKHLFAAIAVEVRNISTSNVTLNNLSFSNIKDKGWASVDYSGAVGYNLSASQTSGLFSQNPNVSISAGKSHMLYSDFGTENAFLIWPHSVPDMVAVQIVIGYKQGSSSISKTINLSENPTIRYWGAGNKYNYLITISDNNISFDVIKVVDWINDDIILEE